jgi:hypothetical protein
MKKRKIIKPGDKRNISFPLDADKGLLEYLNSQDNFSKSLIELALRGFKSENGDDLETRIEKLENIILHNEEVGNPSYNNKKESNVFIPQEESSVINPEEEDDDF